jgi:hypothetical protein
MKAVEVLRLWIRQYGLIGTVVYITFAVGVPVVTVHKVHVRK